LNFPKDVEEKALRTEKETEVTETEITETEEVEEIVTEETETGVGMTEVTEVVVTREDAGVEGTVLPTILNIVSLSTIFPQVVVGRT